MKRTLLFAVILLGSFGFDAQASTLRMRVVPTLVSVSGNTSIWDVAIQAKTDTNQPATNSGGISGLQFDLLSITQNLVPVSAGVGPLASKVKTTFNPVISTNFNTIL